MTLSLILCLVLVGVHIDAPPDLKGELGLDHLYSDLLSAQSKGAFVARFIRGQFPFRRLEQPSDLTQ